MEFIKGRIVGGKLQSEDGFDVLADVVGAGKGDSVGIILMQRDKAVYIPLTAWQDLTDIMNALVDLCDAVTNNIENVIKGAVTTGSETTQTVTTAGSGVTSMKTAISNVKNKINELQKMQK